MQPHYDLTVIKGMVANGPVYIRQNALDDADEYFGWKTDDILDALTKLKKKHFNKTAPHKFKANIKVDIYKAISIKGEDFYTHFYIDDISGRLIINSLHEL